MSESEDAKVVKLVDITNEEGLEAMAENLMMNEWKMRGSIQPKSVKFLFIYIFPSISRLNL
jgi:hypothetical protein